MPKSDNNPIIFARKFSPKNRIFAQNFSLSLHWIFCHKSPHHNINYVKEGHHNINTESTTRWTVYFLIFFAAMILLHYDSDSST